MDDTKLSVTASNNSESNAGDNDATEARLTDLCKVFYF